MKRRHPYCLIICKTCHRIIGLEYWNSIYKNLDETAETYVDGRDSTIHHKCRDKNKKYSKIMIRYWSEMWRINFPRGRKANIPEDLKKLLPRIRN